MVEEDAMLFEVALSLIRVGAGVVFAVQAQQASIFQVDTLSDVLSAFGRQCDGLDLLISLDPGVRRREYQSSRRMDSEVLIACSKFVFVSSSSLSLSRPLRDNSSSSLCDIITSSSSFSA